MRHRHITNPSSFPRFRLTRPNVINLATSLVHDIFNNNPQQFWSWAWARQLQWTFQTQHMPRQATPLVMIQSLDVRSDRIGQRGFVRQFRWSRRCPSIRSHAIRPFENCSSPQGCDSFSLECVSWFRRMPCIWNLLDCLPAADKIATATQNQDHTCQCKAHVRQKQIGLEILSTMEDAGDPIFRKKACTTTTYTQDVEILAHEQHVWKQRTRNAN